MGRDEVVVAIKLAVVGTVGALVTPTARVILVLLLLLMTLEILSGIAAAWQRGVVSSDASFRGLIKKGVTLIAVLTVGLIETSIGNIHNGAPFVTTIALGDLVLTLSATAGLMAWFCLGETLSIVENVDRVGVKLPPGLRRALAIAQYTIYPN